MDSCHIFNFLFGTKRATTELSRCFSNLGERQARGKRRSNSNLSGRVDDQQPPLSPLRQLQMRLTNFTSGNRKFERRRSVSCDAKSGTYRATLVKSTDEGDFEEEEIGLPAASERCGSERRSIVENPLNQLDSEVGPKDEVDLNNNSIITDMADMITAKESVQECDSSKREPGQIGPIDKSMRFKRVVLYGSESDDDQVVPTESQVYEMVPEFGRVRAKLRRVGSELEGYNRDERPLEAKETSEPKKEPADKSSWQDKRSVYVRSVVQSFESTGGRATRAPTTAQSVTRANQSQPAKPTTIVKPLPPKSPPNTKSLAKSPDLQLNKPIKTQQLFLDETFLRKFFKRLAPLDVGAAAQVCRRWRNVLYADQSYWKGLVSVIDCTQLRREQLTECIVSTLQSAKLKQQLTSGSQHSQSQQQPPPRTNKTINHPNGVSARASGESHDIGSLQSSAPAGDTLGSRLQLTQVPLIDLDQEDVWRIQELCNRFTQRGFGQLTARQQQPAANVAQGESVDAEHQHPSNCLASKSSSIPSQISSTFSSVSLSSLLSPLSESSRVDSIKEKLYTSLDERGFDAICLFGATDDDVEDLVCKMPSGAHKRISVGRLHNCCITDRGLDLFVTTFSQLEELELSGCNEVTNSLELRPLKHLRRLILTDCINIADGFSRQLVPLMMQLDELTVQAYHLSDTFIDYLSQNAETKRLRRLELPDCKEVTNQSLMGVAKHFSQLETFSISGSTKISDEGVEILAEQARNLKSLDLSWCTRITDASMECIACDLGATLTDLRLDRNVHITDAGLGYLATMDRLKLLHIRWCPRISDVGIENVLAVKSLRFLSVAGLRQVTARSLLCLVDTDLLEVELTNCPAVNSELIMFLSARMPRCNIIF